MSAHGRLNSRQDCQLQMWSDSSAPTANCLSGAGSPVLSHYYDGVAGPHQCPVCQKYYTSNSHLQRHVRNIHGSDFQAPSVPPLPPRVVSPVPTPSPDVSPPVGAEIEKKKPTTHRCAECKKSFASVGFLKRHLGKFHSHDADESVPTVPEPTKPLRKLISSPSGLRKCAVGREEGGEDQGRLWKVWSALPPRDAQRSAEGLSAEEELLLQMWSEKPVPGPGEPPVRRVATFLCPQCQTSFTSKWHLKRHLKIIHAAGRGALKKQRTITCPACVMKLRNMTALIEHIKRSHPEQNLAEPQTFEFATRQDFERWKCDEERRTASGFMRRQGMDRTKNVQRYNCRRSGTFVRRGTKRHLKSQGSCKVGATCPAYMKAAFSPTGVAVTYYSTHIGHGTDLKHVSLSAAERQQIAAMIQAGIQFDDILTQVRDNLSSDSMSRLHLIHRRDLNNICREYHLENVNRRSAEGQVRKPRGVLSTKPAKRKRTVQDDITDIDSMMTFVRNALVSGERSVVDVTLRGMKGLAEEVNAELMRIKGERERTSAEMPVGSMPVGNMNERSIPIGNMPGGNVLVGNMSVGNMRIANMPIAHLPVDNMPIAKVPIAEMPFTSMMLPSASYLVL